MEIAGIFHEINQAFYGYPQLMETHQYDFKAFYGDDLGLVDESGFTALLKNMGTVPSLVIYPPMFTGLWALMKHIQKQHYEPVSLQ